MKRFRTILLLACAATMAVPAAVSSPSATAPTGSLGAVLRAASNRVVTHASPETGAFDFVRAERGAYLWRDASRAGAESRARHFLARFGDLVGMSDAERAAVVRPGTSAGSASTLRLVRVDRDIAGKDHVRFEQRNRGHGVFGAQVIVHLDRRGVTAVNGHFVGGIAEAASAQPTVAAKNARAAALAAVAKEANRKALRATATDVQWYHLGLVRGSAGAVRLAYAVEVDGGAHGLEQVWVDGMNGVVLDRIPLEAHARNRFVYSPQYDHENPDRFIARREGEPDTNVPIVDNLYTFSGQVYDFFFQGFGRDSWDGQGGPMRTVALANTVCPNAYWNGATTNYCPGFDLDDVVAHEWGHAYTERTHGLIYMCQSGALNESYSDIWGEVIDLTNGMDGVGGTNNDEPHPNGVRWLVGEDLSEPVQEVLLRDMWDPERLGSPATTSSANYVCANNSDNGGVHTNSGIPNLAFASLVDGRTLKGQKIESLGMLRASHIYFQASAVYQTPAIKFAGHQQSLEASCDDLTGVNLPDAFKGGRSGETLTPTHCAQIDKAAAAVEMSKEPKNCQFEPLLKKDPPPLCAGATTVFAEDFEKGLSAWTLESRGLTEQWPDLEWRATDKQPRDLVKNETTLQRGKVAYGPDPDGGSCEKGNDVTGAYAMTSPAITIPAGYEHMRMRFDHYVSTESADGGNVLASVNGGEFELVPNDAYVYNGPVGVIPEPLPGGSGETNPKAGESAWFGTDGGEAKGSWGTTVADLSAIAKPGDTLRLRFAFGLDGCGGYDGWYVDNLRVYNCPVLPAPTEVSIPGGDSFSGPFTIVWQRPDSAAGPDLLQESTLSCAPLLFDDAEGGMGAWETTVEGTGAQQWMTSTKPNHSTSAFAARGLPGVTNASSIMTAKQPVTIPRGTTRLTFKDWFVNEGDDQVRVEVSTNGTAWKPVYTNGRSDYAPFGAAAYQSEPLTSRAVDLSGFGGTTIRLRFRYVLGPEDRVASAPFGWFVDDIAIETDQWTDVVTVPGTSHRVTAHRAATKLCFRVRTSYLVAGALAPSLWSEPSRTIAVGSFGSSGSSGSGGGKRPAVGGVKRSRPLPATGVGSGLLLGTALLAAGALGATALRPKRG